MTVYAVQLEGITKTFGAATAVRNLDLQIPSGSIYGFIGPNGSGKTTTIRMILRIFNPDCGRVEVLGGIRGIVRTSAWATCRRSGGCIGE
ncbi:MAG: ATP-binding cassette domain-containing protein [Planctomycetaceae bacterium]